MDNRVPRPHDEGNGTVDFRILGQMEAVVDGEPLSLGSFKQRSVLALLLLNRGRIVSTDRLIDELWGDDAGSDRQNTLWVHVSNLRSTLEPERSKGSEGTIIRTRAPGYVIPADACALDAGHFEQLLSEGRALRHTDPAAATLVLGEALSIWRGHALEEFAYESFAQAEIARLEELRLEAVESRIAADLDCGLSRELVGELEGLVRAYPTRERFAGQLMLALYRSGRQADALRAYQLVSARLGDDLGLEPSDDLRMLESRIVVSDSTLDLEGGAGVGAYVGATGLSVRGYEVRDRLGEGAFGITYRGFQPAVGREVAIKIIRPEVANQPAFVRSFEEEAQLVARLEHPHIVPLYDYWREPGAAYLVMRLVGPGSLATRLDEGPLDLGSTTRLVEHVGSALDHAHSNGVVHGDVRAENVLVDDAGNAYLADFGIAAGANVASDRFSGSQPPAVGTLTPTVDISGLARVTAQALTGRLGDLSDLRVGLDPVVAQVLGDADGDGPYSDVLAFTEAIIDALAATTGEHPLITTTVANPYKGLRAFKQSDATDFFGRERLIDRLVARLGRSAKTGRFVAVVGPSGCGKSSLVKAGLLPALRNDAAPASAEWFQVEMVPGQHPYEQLETALMGVAVDPPASFLEHLTGADGIRKTVSRILPDDHSQLLLVVDQLEELFTLATPDTAERFLDALASAVTAEPSRVRVVITLRADFYDRPLQHRAFGELLREGTEIVTPMSPAELEQAITEPARQQGVTFDRALVAEIVAEAAEHPTALPLLQYALTEVFERRRGSVIELPAYREIGGVSGALADRAEGLYAVLDEDARITTRQVFLRLVAIGEGRDDTRRRVVMNELRDLGVNDESATTVIDSYGRHRLLSFDRDPITRTPTVEVSHEALLHGWARLDGWIEDARSAIRDQRRISEATKEWMRSGKDGGFLMRSPQLDRLVASVEEADLSLSSDEAAFLQASIALRDRARAEVADHERRRVKAEAGSRRRAQFLGATAAFAIIVTLLGVFALYQRQQAKEAEQRAAAIADGTRIAAVANRTDDPETAILLSLQATELLAIPGEAIPEIAEETMHLAAQKARLTYPPGDWAIGSIAQRAGTIGVYLLPPEDLVDHLRSNVTRTFTTEECASFDLLDPCPPPDGSLATPAHTGPPATDLSETASALATGPPLAPRNPVTVIGPWNDYSGPLGEFAAFEDATSVSVAYEWSGGPVVAASERAHLGNPPDVVLVPQPGAMVDLENEIGVIDLAAYLDQNVLVTDFGEYAMSQATMSADGSWPASQGRTLAVPTKADIKALVWYPKAAFKAAGYDTPRTWDELIALSDRIVADGGRPWCEGWMSGPASGWPGTDWIEGLLLRTGGLDLYDGWVAHEIPFDHPDVMAAADALDQIIMTPEYVLNRPESISQTQYGLRIWPMFQEDGPACWLAYGANFMTNFIPNHVDQNAAAGIFPLPPTETGGSTPLLGGSVYAVVLTDRPEVREFVRWLASPEFGALWAGQEGSEFLSGNARFDLENYGEPQELRKEMGRIVQHAWQTSEWRFDGSDLMPGSIGAFMPEWQPGSFWKGMLDYVDGKRSIEQVMHDIEADWVALEAERATQSSDS